MILTACNGISPLGFLEPTTRDGVRAAIDQYTRKVGKPQGHEELWGTQLLGYPIGRKKFAQEYLQRIVTEIDLHTHNVCTKLDDLQTMLQVYCTAILPKAPHLFAADVYHNLTKACDTFKWRSSFSKAITTKTRDLLARVSGKLNVPTWVLAIAHLRMQDGGLGVLDLTLTAIPLYLQSITSSIRYALEGVPLKHRPDDPVHVPKELRALFAGWRESGSPFFARYRCHAEPAFRLLYPKADDAVDHAIHLGRRTRVVKAIKELNAEREVEAVYEAVPDEVRPYLPMMLSKHTSTSVALVGMSRLDRATQLDNTLFRIAILRKFRLPLWDAPPERMC